MAVFPGGGGRIRILAVSTGRFTEAVRYLVSEAKSGSLSPSGAHMKFVRRAPSGECPCMSQSSFENARSHLAQSQKLLAACQSDAFLGQLAAVSGAIAHCFKAGGKILLAGNGGSAADAQHIAGEFLSRLNFDRAPLMAIALTVDTSVLTAIGNDYGYELVFERQVKGLGRPGDVFIGISTSGRSPNILRALRKAREIGVTTVGFC